MCLVGSASQEFVRSIRVYFLHDLTGESNVSYRNFVAGDKALERYLQFACDKLDALEY